MAADVIVVGLGAVGAAATYQLARRGARVTGLDRWAPPHAMGSSHGETRITRCGVGEGAHYTPLAIRSHEIWRELEGETGLPLLLACGLIVIGPADDPTPRHGKTDFVRRSAEGAARHGVHHEMLDAAEIMRRYPQFALEGGEVGYFEPGGGLVYPERCIEAQLVRARALGATVETGVRVTSLSFSAAEVRVHAGEKEYAAETAILCAGAWTSALAGADFAPLALQPQTLHWWEADPAVYSPERFPAFMWLHGPGPADLFYGFPIAPAAPTQGVKAATEAFEAIADPDAMAREAAPQAGAAVYETHVRRRLIGVGPRRLRSAACLYTRTPDAEFVIDRHPLSERLIVASACSGHGFKHSAAVGELVARIAVGEASPPPAFARARPALAT